MIIDTCLVLGQTFVLCVGSVKKITAPVGCNCSVFVCCSCNSYQLTEEF